MGKSCHTLKKESPYLTILFEFCYIFFSCIWRSREDSLLKFWFRVHMDLHFILILFFLLFLFLINHIFQREDGQFSQGLIWLKNVLKKLKMWGKKFKNPPHLLSPNHVNVLAAPQYRMVWDNVDCISSLTLPCIMPYKKGELCMCVYIYICTKSV